MEIINYCIHRYRFHLLARKGMQPKGLSKKEERLRHTLAKITGEGLYKSHIRSAIIKGTDESFRALVRELKDQLRDAPGPLENIIGCEAIGLLKRL